MKTSKLKLYLSFFILATIVVFAIDNLSGDNTTAIKGAISVPYSVILNNNDSISAFQVELTYPTDLTLTNIQSTSRTSDITIVVNNQTEGFVSIAAIVNDDNSQIEPGNGSILNLIFDVDSDATEGTYSMILDNLITADIETTSIPTSTTNGTFTIVEPYTVSFLAPISNFNNFTLQDGATLPLKFDVFEDSTFINDPSVLVRIYNTSLGIDHTYNASGSGSEFIDIDEGTEKYQINIHTGQLGMPLGAYIIEVTFSQFQTETIGFELVQQGPTNGKGKGKQI